MECGSTIFMQYNVQRGEEGKIWIAVGSIDEGSLEGDKERKCLRPREHIYVGDVERASWHDLPIDRLERVEGLPRGFEDKLKESLKSKL